MSELLILILGLIIGALTSFVMLSYALEKVHSKLNRLEKICIRTARKISESEVKNYEKY